MGEVIVEHPDGNTEYEKMFKIQFEFGDTDIAVSGERQKDNTVTRTKIDCLK